MLFYFYMFLLSIIVVYKNSGFIQAGLGYNRNSEREAQQEDGSPDSPCGLAWGNHRNSESKAQQGNGSPDSPCGLAWVAPRYSEAEVQQSEEAKAPQTALAGWLG